MKIKIGEWLDVVNKIVQLTEEKKELKERRDLLLDEIIDYIEDPNSDKAQNFKKRMEHYRTLRTMNEERKFVMGGIQNMIKPEEVSNENNK